MITLKLLNDYLKYSGNLDAWSRVNRNKVSLYDDWMLIDNLIQNLKLIENNLASESFILETKNKILENCDNYITISKFYKIAGVGPL